MQPGSVHVLWSKLVHWPIWSSSDDFIRILLKILCYHHMASNSRFMYDNVAPSFANLIRFMITQIPYHYTSISTNIITYVTTW